MPYTETFPVLTSEFLDQSCHKSSWMDRWIRPSSYRQLIRVSSSPTVLGPDPVEPFGLRVWRQQVPPLVQAFTKVALQILGSKAIEKIGGRFDVSVMRNVDGYFNAFDYIGLTSNGQLAGRQRDHQIIALIKPECIADLYIEHGIDQKLANSFSTYFCNSLTMCLQNMPADTGLKLQVALGKYLPELDRKHRHSDLHDHLIFNLTDPGTLYQIQIGFIQGFGFSATEFRSIDGDITLHGGHIFHDSPTAPQENRLDRPRFALGFKVERNLPIPS